MIKTLNSAGYGAYIVGGCVRDSMMGRTPADWDIATSATPQDVKDLFDKTLDTGIKHGTVTVLYGGEGFEVTTFRVDGRYEDSRRPASVAFTGSVEADLSRRDFTMNAIAYHPETGFIDPFDGIGDIAGGLIRTVGCADDRFREDALRMLRAVRFSAQLDFTVDAAALASIGRNGRLIEKISAERIRDELARILTSGNPGRFRLLQDTGLLHYIMPEFEVCFHTPQNHPHHIYSVAEHSLHAAEAVENDACLRWTMLLHDIGKAVTRTTDDKGVDHFCGHPEEGFKIAGTILKRLRFDNAASERILELVRLHDRQILPGQRTVARAVCALGGDVFEDLLKVKRADKLAQNPEFKDEGLKTIAEISRIYSELKESGRCLSLKDLAVNGRDLMEAGLPQGREIGRILKLLLKKVVDDPGLNRRDKLLELVEKRRACKK